MTAPANGPMMNFGGIKLPGSGQQQQNGKTDEAKPSPKYYMNIFMEIPVKQADGTEKVYKLQFPRGIALDGVTPREIPGPKTKNVEFRETRLLEAQFTEQFMNQLSTFKAGETRPCAQLKVEVHMVDEKTEPTAADLASLPKVDFKF